MPRLETSWHIPSCSRKVDLQAGFFSAVAPLTISSGSRLTGHLDQWGLATLWPGLDMVSTKCSTAESISRYPPGSSLSYYLQLNSRPLGSISVIWNAVRFQTIMILSAWRDCKTNHDLVPMVNAPTLPMASTRGHPSAPGSRRSSRRICSRLSRLLNRCGRGLTFLLRLLV
jgi:hypothetical protein